MVTFAGSFCRDCLKGSTLRADCGENEVLYGRDLDTRDVVMGKVAATGKAAASCRPLRTTLGKKALASTSSSWANRRQPHQTAVGIDVFAVVSARLGHIKCSHPQGT